MLRSRRLFLPALGALVLIASGSIAWKAHAETVTPVTVRLNSMAPNPVASGGNVQLDLTVTTTTGSITAVSAQTLAATGISGSAVVPLTLVSGHWKTSSTRPLVAPKNTTTTQKSVQLQVNATYRVGTTSRIVAVKMNTLLKVNPGSSGGGGTTTPPPPPKI
jgi:hypothetical protein